MATIALILLSFKFENEIASFKFFRQNFDIINKLLNEEIATILHISPDEVPQYIKNNIS